MTERTTTIIECDLCGSDDEDNEQVFHEIPAFLGRMLDRSMKGPAEHMCMACYVELEVVLLGFRIRRTAAK